MLLTKSQYNYGLPAALKLLAQAKRHERASREELAGVQKRRFKQLLDHAVKNSAFYQKLYEGSLDGRAAQIGFDEIEKLPVVTKSAMMESMDEVLTDSAINKEAVLAFAEDQSNVGRMFRDKYFVARTSGTTGLVGHYVHDLFSFFLCFVLTGARSKARGDLSFRELPSLIGRRTRLASMLSPAANLGVSSVMAAAPEFVRWFIQIKLYDIFQQADKAITSLNEYQPDILGSFPTILQQLADYQLEGRLKLRPKAMTSGGEVLTPRIRNHVSEAFGCKVFDYYGCAESGWLGMECERQQGIHLFTDWFIVEPVDHQGNRVPPGVESDRVLITNMANYVQPFIRFELPDRVTVLEDQCPCGSVFPRVLVRGRTSELLRFLDNDRNKVNVPPFHLTTLAEMVPGIARYQIIQDREDHLTVRFTARSEAVAHSVHTSLKSSFEKYLKEQQLNAAVALSVQQSDTIERDPSGKVRQVFSRLGT
jgi:phenylacetate-CoA ligase